MSVPEHQPRGPHLPAKLSTGEQHQVLQNGHPYQLPANLEGAQDALLENPVGRQAIDSAAQEPDIAAGWLQKSGYQIEGGDLACPIGPNQPGDGAGTYIEGTVVDSPYSANVFDHIFDSQDRPALSGFLVRRLPH